MFLSLCRLTLLWVLAVPNTLAQGYNGTNTSTPSTLTAPLDISVTASVPLTRNSSSNDSIQACNSRWQSYKSRLRDPYTTDTTTITLGLGVETSYLGIQTCSSYCGDICYADTKNITRTTLVTQIYTNYSYSTVKRLTFTELAPNCTIPPASCKQLWSEYTIAEASFKTAPNPNTPKTPGCTNLYCTRTTCKFGGGDKGALPTDGVVERYWYSLSLFYWPAPKTISRDMCAYTPAQTGIDRVPSASSYVPTTTEGFTVVDGNTLYKGNVYISIPQMEVSDNCGWSTALYDVVFPVASTDLYSNRGDVMSSRNYPVQWADFNEPVPYSAIVGGGPRTFSVIPGDRILDPVNYCKTAICDSRAVLPGSYEPWIVLPQAVQNVHPDFAGCAIDYDHVFFDPPIALQDVPDFLTTASGDHITTSAEPASTHVALPVQTSTSQTYTPRPPKHTASADRPLKDPSPDAQLPNNPGPDGPAAPNKPGPNEPDHNGPDPHHPTPDNAAPGTPPTKADPANAPRPHITAGPTLIPIAPDGQGLILHSSTAIPVSGSAIIDGTTLHIQSGILTVESPAGTSSMSLSEPNSGPSSGGDPVTLTLGGTVLTIASSSGSLVLGSEATLRAGDAGKSVGDMVLHVDSEGVQMEDMQTGKKTYIVFADVDFSAPLQDESPADVISKTGAAHREDGEGTADSAGQAQSSAQKSSTPLESVTRSSQRPTRPGDDEESESGVSPNSPSNSREGAAATILTSRSAGLVAMLVFVLIYLI